MFVDVVFMDPLRRPLFDLWPPGEADDAEEGLPVQPVEPREDAEGQLGHGGRPRAAGECSFCPYLQIFSFLSY